MEYLFRDLKAEEIDVRVATVNDKGVTLLLYKDARVDEDILDETVGPYNWQRIHLRDNANCVVELWDSEKQMWIKKEDTGTESNIEKEKGLASSSFKRSCTNWGIGRELYTAPFIWVSKDNVSLYDTKRKDKYGNAILSTNDKFYVEKIEITDKVITGLSIKNQNNKRVFVYSKNNKKGDK